MKRWIFLCLVLIIACGTTAYPQTQDWPVRHKPDLSSGFGDFREGRFHAGVDLRTGGRIGRPIYSPVDGYVWRVKMSYRGYGKGLYVRGDDDHTYVYAHMYMFNDVIEEVVKEAQLRDERYYQDLRFEVNQIPVAKGDLLGYTGQTGAGAPHLHFEKRSPENRPLNPLTHGFVLDDRIAPTIERIGFEMTDSKSLFYDGSRQLMREVTAVRPGEFVLADTLYFREPFGVLIDGWDQMRAGAMRQAVYKYTVLVDDREIYRSVFDSVDFATNRAVYFEYVYPAAADGDKRIRRLWLREENQHARSRPLNKFDGIIGLRDNFAYGPHTLRVIAEDAFGNRSELRVPFVWGPDENIFAVDSTVAVHEDSMAFFLSPGPAYSDLRIKQVDVLTEGVNDWLRLPEPLMQNLDGGAIRVTLPRRGLPALVARLFLESDYGVSFDERPFNGLVPGALKAPTATYDISEDGLVIKVDTRSKAGSQLHLGLSYKGKLLGREFFDRYLGKRYYQFFVPPRPEYARVDSLILFMTDDTTETEGIAFPVQLMVAGFDDRQDLHSADSLFVVSIERENLYAPQWVGITSERVTQGARYGVHSDLYRIQPAAFPTRSDFRLRGRITRMNEYNPFAGLCWLDEKKDKWVWLSERGYKDQVVEGVSLGGGAFAVVLDYDPPVIEFVDLPGGRTLYEAQPTIEIKITDSLSGFEDDTNFRITIDKQWMIPEYDFETGVMKITPPEALEDGEYHLVVRATDRAGHTAEAYRIFKIRAVDAK